jgi:hypothetical protein
MYLPTAGFAAGTAALSSLILPTPVAVGESLNDVSSKFIRPSNLLVLKHRT